MPIAVRADSDPNTAPKNKMALGAGKMNLTKMRRARQPAATS
jgi:hypothetical protein